MNIQLTPKQIEEFKKDCWLNIDLGHRSYIYYESNSDGTFSYGEIDIKYTDGYSVYHLCKVCHRQLMTEFMREVKPEEYEEIYGEW